MNSEFTPSFVNTVRRALVAARQRYSTDAGIQRLMIVLSQDGWHGLLDDKDAHLYLTGNTVAGATKFEGIDVRIKTDATALVQVLPWADKPEGRNVYTQAVEVKTYLVNLHCDCGGIMQHKMDIISVTKEGKRYEHVCPLCANSVMVHGQIYPATMFENVPNGEIRRTPVTYGK